MRVEAVEALLAGEIEARVAAMRLWPAGRRCPLGRLREAWVAHRYGLARVNTAVWLADQRRGRVDAAGQATSERTREGWGQCAANDIRI